MSEALKSLRSGVASSDDVMHIMALRTDAPPMYRVSRARVGLAANLRHWFARMPLAPGSRVWPRGLVGS